MDSITIDDVIIRIHKPIKSNDEGYKLISIKLLKSVKVVREDIPSFGSVLEAPGVITLPGQFKVDDKLIDNIIELFWEKFGIKILKDSHNH